MLYVWGRALTVTCPAGSLNFRDVMLAYGKLSKDLMSHGHGGHQIGLEFSGKVTHAAHPTFFWHETISMVKDCTYPSRDMQRCRFSHLGIGSVGALSMN